MKHDLNQIELTGGAKLLIINLPNAHTVYFASMVRSGVRLSPLERHELPHLLEHLAFEENKHFPQKMAFRQAVDNAGAWGNASTGIDAVTYYYVTTPERLSAVVDLNLAQTFEPLFLPASVESEKRVVIQEVSQRADDDGFQRIYRNFQQITPKLYPDPAARIQGTKATTASEVAAFYRAHYGAANTWFVAAGAFQANEQAALADQLNSYLHKVIPGQRIELSPESPSDYGGKLVIAPANTKTQSHLLINFVQPGYDRVALAPLQLFSTLAGVPHTGRIFALSRDKGLSYGTFSGSGFGLDFSHFYLADQTTNEKFMPLFNLAVEQLADLLAGNFSVQEFNRAKAVMIGGLSRSTQTPADFASWYGNDFMSDRPLERPGERVEQVRSVTKDKMLETAAHYINAQNWVLTLLGQALEPVTEHFRTKMERTFS